MGLKSTTLKLSDIVYDDTVPFVPHITKARVIKVYDGDTFTIGFFQPHSDTPFRMAVRLLGIDTPELKPHSGLKTRTGVLKAKAAQSLLSSYILGQDVMLTEVSLDRYGRLLANVHCGDLNINKLMLDSQLAVPYDGGCKLHRYN